MDKKINDIITEIDKLIYFNKSIFLSEQSVDNIILSFNRYRYW